VTESVVDASAQDQPLRNRWHRVLLVAWLAYWAILTYLLLAPKVPRAPITISPKGLVIHCFTFACLAYGRVVVRRAGGGRSTWRWALVWAVVLAAYGGLAELIQPLTGRDCDIEDFLADAVGVVVVLLVATIRDWRRPGAR